MKKTLAAIACVILSAGLTGFLQGCASPPESLDTDQIRQHSEEGFKELQKEEDHHR